MKALTINQVDDASAALVASRAQELSGALDPAQRAQLHQSYEPGTIRNWSNLPQAVLGRRGRLGLSTGSLSPPQWTAVQRLLAAATSAPGQARVAGHLAADDHLRALGGSHGYGRGEFVIALLGRPGPVGTWQLQFGGHHLALARTYRDGRLVGATPAFWGIEPFAAFRHQGRSYDPERGLRESFAALLATLSPAQARAAALPSRHDDLLLGPGRDWAFPDRPAGLPGSALDPGQRGLLRRAMAAFVGDLDSESAAPIQAGYDAELDATHVGWSGSTDLSRVGAYVRIDGPSVWLEVSMRPGVVRPGAHPHAVWRDRGTDYGRTRF